MKPVTIAAGAEPIRQFSGGESPVAQDWIEDTTEPQSVADFVIETDGSAGQVLKSIDEESNLAASHPEITS